MFRQFSTNPVESIQIRSRRKDNPSFPSSSINAVVSSTDGATSLDDDGKFPAEGSSASLSSATTASSSTTFSLSSSPSSPRPTLEISTSPLMSSNQAQLTATEPRLGKRWTACSLPNVSSRTESLSQFQSGTPNLTSAPNLDNAVRNKTSTKRIKWGLHFILLALVATSLGTHYVLLQRSTRSLSSLALAVGTTDVVAKAEAMATLLGTNKNNKKPFKTCKGNVTKMSKKQASEDNKAIQPMQASTTLRSKNNKQQQKARPANHSTLPAAVAALANPHRFARFTASTNFSCQDPIASAADVNVTLVTQCSFNRLWMMQHHCQRWGKGWPISLAVFVPGVSTASAQKAATAELKTRLVKEMHCWADRLTVQVVFPSPRPSSSSFSKNEVGKMVDFPVNQLRNLALAAVKTTHVLYVDVDFWPSAELVDTLGHAYVRHRLMQTAQHRLALVVPAFSLHSPCPKKFRSDHPKCIQQHIGEMPHTRKDLRAAHETGFVDMFDPKNVGGHGTTRYDAWWKQGMPLSNLEKYGHSNSNGNGNNASLPLIVDLPCLKSTRYEPYFLHRHCMEVPPFQEAFSGYGKNKISWILQLRRAGWNMAQLGGGAFLVHFPHGHSAARKAWNGGSHGKQLSRQGLYNASSSHNIDYMAYQRGVNDATYVAFWQWMLANVPDETRFTKCEGSTDDEVSKLWVPGGTDLSAFDHKALGHEIEYE